MLNGSAWSTERKYMRRYKGKCDIFGIEEGGNGGAVQQRAKEGWRSAADATDTRAGSEDQQRTSGGVFVTADSNLGAVVGEKEGAVT